MNTLEALKEVKKIRNFLNAFDRLEHILSLAGAAETKVENAQRNAQAAENKLEEINQAISDAEANHAKAISRLEQNRDAVVARITQGVNEAKSKAEEAKQKLLEDKERVKSEISRMESEYESFLANHRARMGALQDEMRAEEEKLASVKSAVSDMAGKLARVNG